MNRNTVVVLAALLLVTAGLLGVASAQSAGGAATDTGDAPGVTVSATGDASAAPDRATVHASVVAVADTAEEARRLAAEDASGLRAALADADVDEDAVSTVGYHLGTDYRRDEVDGYRVTHRFAVELDDVDAAGAVVDAAVAGGANRVDGVTFSLSDEQRRDLRGDAIAAAMADARADAGAIATAANVSIDGLLSVATGGDGYAPVYREAADADAGTTIDPGPVSVSVSVTVTYAVS
jgi:uncharacterized protein YggE